MDWRRPNWLVCGVSACQERDNLEEAELAGVWCERLTSTPDTSDAPAETDGININR
jgi:hypothetical protein